MGNSFLGADQKQSSDERIAAAKAWAEARNEEIKALQNQNDGFWQSLARKPGYWMSEFSLDNAERGDKNWNMEPENRNNAAEKRRDQIFETLRNRLKSHQAPTDTESAQWELLLKKGEY